MGEVAELISIFRVVVFVAFHVAVVVRAIFFSFSVVAQVVLLHLMSQGLEGRHLATKKGRLLHG